MLEEDLTEEEKWKLARRRCGKHVTPETNHLRGLDACEVFFILRLRSGRTRQQVADGLGVHTRQLERMEKGQRDLKRLRAYWGM